VKYLALYFLTTSNIKIAHVSYLLSRHGLRIFRSRRFNGYPELQDEARYSLRAGAEYLRNRYSVPFFIEDTEVRIDAYSRDYNFSYPGFDIKRWWRVTSFEEIDAKCRQAGTREASQTSHICLSVPGLPLFFYKGEVKGTIASERQTHPDNPATPWLSSREFGSIFIPKDADNPFVFLPLEESLKFDFRKRSTDRLAAKLYEINKILNLDPACYRLEEEGEQVQVLTPNQLQLYDLEDVPENGGD
jgi:inosine/xanthosine triphosphate pyrophosphatase family protein